jgi:hypothetical protein
MSNGKLLQRPHSLPKFKNDSFCSLQGFSFFYCEFVTVYKSVKLGAIDLTLRQSRHKLQKFCIAQQIAVTWLMSVKNEFSLP